MNNFKKVIETLKDIRDSGTVTERQKEELNKCITHLEKHQRYSKLKIIAIACKYLYNYFSN